MSDAIDIRPIIGLEVHVQLATATKLFCPCRVEFAAEPNSRVCPVCMGMPGTLPVMNRRAYELSVRAALALNCEIATFTKWDRKSYYYPDLPKNYQISQYDLPLSFDGEFEIPMADGRLKKVGIIRAHLEEDAGKNIHEGLDHTRVDLNRTGTPLLEIVTQPDLADAEEAYTFCVELQRLMQYIGVSEANMQKGQMRFEPNVNAAITHQGREYRTPICEIKNLNSFRSVRLAIAHEIDRQVHAWREDHDYTLAKLGKMNLGWDDVREVTEFQRGKEESHDYRYFPDPDLVPVTVTTEWIEQQRAQLGELPLARQRRFTSEYELSAKDCEIILADAATADLFDSAVNSGVDYKILTKQFLGIWNHLASSHSMSIGALGLPAAAFADLARAVQDGKISPTAAAQVATHVIEHRDANQNVIDVARSLGLLQERDESVTLAWIDDAFAANPQAVADALGTNEKKAKAAPGFLCGQVMKISKGKADPRLCTELIVRRLKTMQENQ